MNTANPRSNMKPSSVMSEDTRPPGRSLASKTQMLRAGFCFAVVIAADNPDIPPPMMHISTFMNARTK